MTGTAGRAGAPAPAQDREQLRRWAPPLAVLVVFGVMVALIHRELRDFRYHDVMQAVRTLPGQRVLAAAGLTALVYAVLPAYDWLALRYVSRPRGWLPVWFASTIAYGISQTLGFAALTGGSVRYRFWSSWGLSAADITRGVAFVGVNFTLGILSVSSLAVLFDPAEASALVRLPVPAVTALAVVAIAVVAGYIVLAAWRGGTMFAIRGVDFRVPAWRLAVGQVVAAIVDWCLAAAVLYVLFDRAGLPPFLPFLAVFVLAQGAGAASHVPGGLGVFETIMLVALRGAVTPDVLLATIVAYRAIYYLLPFCVAVLAVLSYEAWLRRGHLRSAVAVALKGTSLVMPVVLALATFVSGVILLVSGATPAIGTRLAALDRVLPLGIIEVSHFLSSLVGSGLIVLAWALRRRLDAAWGLAVALLALGVLASLTKGLDWEEALVLASVLGLLLPSRRAFYRRASLLAEPFEPGWIVAVACVIGATIWLGLFSYRHVEYRADLWWAFTRNGDAPRFLRASVGALSGLLVFGLSRLLRQAEHEPELPGEEELRRASAVVRTSPDPSGYLALLGDKSLLFSPSGRGFVMYAVEGRSWVAMGDPIGPPEDQAELAWSFRVLTDRHGAWPVFYQVRTESLPTYIDLGLSLVKLGEEAVVPLATFSLDGGERKGLRRAHREVERLGVGVEVIPPDELGAVLPALRAVSDEWLASKSVREKGFSLGRFDEAYLRNFPVAVARHEGRIVAFSNLWPGAPGTELTVDLMRYGAAAPRGVMDYLFIEVMLWGRANGFAAFGLGMAPMSGLQDRALATFWNRAGAYLFAHGEHFYNFQGLRQYKEKYHPQWRPRYLASPGGLALPRILANVATLISGGIRGLVQK